LWRPTSSLRDIIWPLLENNPLAWIPPVLENSDWLSLNVAGDLIIISLEILGKDFKVLSFLIISNESKEVLPQTPHDEFVKKFLLILSISTFSELFNVATILFCSLYSPTYSPILSIFSIKSFFQ